MARERVTSVSLVAKISAFRRDVRSGARDVRELRGEAERFSRGRYDAKVGADTKAARTELSALEKRLQAFAKTPIDDKRINLDTDEARDRLRRLQERLSQFGTRVSDARVDLDDAEAQAKLSRFEAALLKLGARTTEADIDLAGIAEAEGQLGALESRLRSFDGNDYRAEVHVDGTLAATRQASALADAIALLGPAAIPIAASTAPAIAGLTSDLTAAAGAGGTAALAFAGVGDALEAMGKAEKARAGNRKDQARAEALANRQVRDAKRALAQARVDAAKAAKTEGADVSAARQRVADAQRNLTRAQTDAKYVMAQQSAEAEQLREKMAALSPAGRRFVRFLDDLRPKVERLQAAAQAGLLPGVEDGIRELLRLMPRAESIVDSYATALGQLAREGGDALNDPFWRRFFRFLDEEANQTLIRMGRTVGNIAEGFAGLVMALDPLSDDFSKSFLGMSRDFSKWGRELRRSEGYHDFVRYVQRVSPEVWDTLGTVADTMLDIAEAAAPVGEATLPVIRTLARILGDVADSPVGPVLIGAAAGLASVNRMIRIADTAKYSRVGTLIAGWGQSAGSSRSKMGRLADFMGPGGGWAFALTGAFALYGIWRSKQAKAEAKVDSLTESLHKQTGAITRNTKAQIVNALEEEGVLETARRHGISIALVTRAALGNTAAQRKLGAELKGRMKDYNAFDHVSRKTLNPALRQLQENVLGEAGAVADAREEWKRKKTAMDAVTGSTRQSSKATGANRGQLKQLADQLNLTDRQTRQLVHSINDEEKASKGARGDGRLHEKQLRQVASQLGLTRDQAQRLIQKYRDIPKNVRTTGWFDDVKARRDVRKFRSYVDGQFKELADGTYAITVNGRSGHGRLFRATGGPVVGPGGPTDDMVPATGPGGSRYALSAGEWISRAAAVNREGPDAFRGLDRGTHRIVRRAGGGPVDDHYRGPRIRVDTDFSDLRHMVRQMVRAFSFSSFPQDYRHISFRGVTLDRRTALMIRAAETLLRGGQRFDLTQGSYNPGGVAASGGTHDGGGAFDADSPFTRAAVVALRRVGFAAWRRYPSQGPWGTHIHAIDPLNRHLSAAARSQAASYRSGGDGLGGRDYEPRVRVAAMFRSPIGKGALNRYERYIVQHESSGRVRANNPSSTAFGLGQLLLANRERYAARLGVSPYTTDRAAQIAMMRMYIDDRYGSSRAAYRFHRAHGWYDRGGILPKGLSLAMNNTGRNEHKAVFTDEQWRALKALITGLTMNHGRAIRTGWLERMLHPVVKDVGRLHREFVHTRDAMRGFRVRTERRRAALDRIHDSDRFEKRHDEARRAERRFDRTRTGAQIGADIHDEHRDINRQQRHLDRARRAGHEQEAKEAREAIKASRKKLKALRDERDERRKLHRQMRRANNADILIREEKAQKRLNERLKDQKQARREATAAAKAYKEAQKAAIESTREEAQSLLGGVDLFGGFISPRGAQHQVDDAIERITEYGQTMAKLRRRGVHPWLLAEFRRQGPTEAGIRLGRALLKDPAALSELSTSAGALSQLTDRVGTVVGDPRFMSPGPWNPVGHVSTRVLNIEIKTLDISQVSGEIRRQVRHEIDAAFKEGVV